VGSRNKCKKNGNSLKKTEKNAKNYDHPALGVDE
jgi:hypothetical protein